MHTMTAVLDDIAHERERQDAEWGGVATDDRHSPWVWKYLRERQERRAMMHYEADGRIVESERLRDHLVNIAALTIAQLDALDRVTGRV